jgi:hypothetical protein
MEAGTLFNVSATKKSEGAFELVGDEFSFQVIMTNYASQRM